MAKIMVIEDELSIQKLLTYDLQHAGFEVDVASDGLEGYNRVKEGDYDVVLLDVMLPKMNGIEVCRKLRKDQNDVYIIMLTARGDELDKITGLDAGADDYITKPFSPREVLARIKAGLRRQGNKETTELITLGNLKVNTKRHEVFINDEEIQITYKEYKLLVFLLMNKGVALSRDVLLETLWGFEYDGDTRIVDVHIFKLREKLADSNIKIVTIRGLGYRLEDEMHDE